MSTINVEGIQSAVTLQDNMTSGFENIIRSIDAMLGSINMINSTPLIVDTARIDVSGVQSGMNNLQNEMLSLANTHINTDVSPLTNGLNQAAQVAINTNTAIEPLRDVMIEVDNSQLLALQQDAFEGQRGINQLEDQVGDLISENTRLQNQFNDALARSNSPVRNLLGNLKSIVGVYSLIRAGKALFETSSVMTDSVARLEIMNDGRQSTDDLNKMVRQTALNTYSDYGKTLDMITQLQISGGKSFGSNQEAIAFADLINKQMALSGTSESGRGAVMTQLPQAFAKGVLRGQELNTIFEQMPTMIDTIGKHLGKDAGELRKMAEDGKLTANVIKGAMFAMSDDINSKFASMPITLKDLKNNAVTIFTTGLSPIFSKLESLANNDSFQKLVYGVASSMATLASIGFNAFSMLATGIGFVAKNMHIILPVLVTLTGAYMMHKSAVVASTIATAKDNIVKWAGVAVTGAQSLAIGTLNILKLAGAAATTLLTGATISSTAAMWGLNGAMLANPIGVIIGGVVLLIGLLFGAVAAINKFTDANISMVGLVAGGFAFVGSVVANVFKILANTIILAVAAIWNPIAAVAEFVGNVFNDPVNTVKRLFVDMANSIINVLAKIASGMDFVFGTNLAGGLKDLQSELNNWSKNNVAKAEFKVPRMDPNELLFSTSNPFEDAKKGYEWGKDKNIAIW